MVSAGCSGCIAASISHSFPARSLSLCLSPAPSGTQHASRINTNKQCRPSLLPLPSHPREFMWDGAIASLRSMLHFPNKERVRIGNVHFEPLHKIYISSLSIPLSLFRGFFFLNLWTFENRHITVFSYTCIFFPEVSTLIYVKWHITT